MNDIASSAYLRKNAELQALLNAIDRVQGIVELDLDGRLLSANDNFLSWFGYAASELLGQPHATICRPEYAASQDYRAFWEKLRSGEFHAGEFARVAKDGRTVWIQASYNPVFDDDGTVRSIVKFATNVTAEKLRNADFESKLRALDLSEAVIEFDLTGRVLRANDNFLRIFNYTLDQVVGRHHLMFCEESYVRTPAYAELWRSLGEGRYRTGEFKRIDSLGREVWLQATYNPVMDAEGRLVKIVKFATDITEQKRRNADFEGVVSAIKRSVAVIEFDLKGRVLDISPQMAAILEYAPEDLIGEHHTRLLDPETFDQEKYTAFWAALRRGEPLRDEVVRVSRSGRRIHMEASYTPVADAEGRIYKVIKFAIDLTERHALNEALREAVRRAQAATEAKTMFLANMSHEIRTPMNAIIGFTDLLAQEQLGERQAHYAGTIGTSARSLLHLLNDILDASKLEHGSMEIEQIDFCLQSVCEHCVDTMAVLAQRKGISLELDYRGGLPPYFTGDPERIRQVLINLTSNAIKFTERGGVTITIAGNAAGHVEIAVRDTGIGIPADRIDKIFEPFSQADGSITRRYGGTGLGTTIVRQLVSLMDGHIEVTSEVGSGSEFRVTLPLRPGRKPAERIAGSLDDIEPLRILVVDDAPQNIELLVNVLAKGRHVLTPAENGQQAVELFAAGTFDLILMDVHMPVMDGLEAAREIRRIEGERGKGEQVPMIALTASVEAERRHLVIEAGMDSFVMKPIDVAILKAEIARIATGRILPLAAALPRTTSAGEGAGHEHIDWASGIDRWGGEAPLLRALRTFTAETRRHLQALRAVPATDATAIGQAMHRIKGAAGNLSLPGLAGLARRGEAAAGELSEADHADLLDGLDGEIEAVAGLLEARSPYRPASGAATHELADADLADLIDRVAATFRNFEIDEDLLIKLSAACPRDRFEPLQQAVDAFDFEAGLRALDSIKQSLTV